MSSAPRVEVKLLGQTLVVRSGAPAEYLASLAAYVEERVAMLQRAGVRDPMAALSLASLDIVDELFRARDDKSREADQVQNRIGALIALLDQITPDAQNP